MLPSQQDHPSLEIGLGDGSGVDQPTDEHDRASHGHAAARPGQLNGVFDQRRRNLGGSHREVHHGFLSIRFALADLVTLQVSAQIAARL